MKIWQEFQEFAVKGNVVDMAVGVMIGAAFASVVQSLVNDVIMPPIGLLTGGMDFSDLFVVIQAGSTPGPYATVADAETAGAVIVRYGLFANQILSFAIISMVLFLAVRWISELRRPDSPPAPNTRPCPFCQSNIHLQATRCPQCTSDVATT